MRIERLEADAEQVAYPYRWAWKGHDSERQRCCLRRQDQRCRVIVRGAMNSALIEFEDGFRVVTSRNGLRRNDGANSRSMTRPMPDPPVSQSEGFVDRTGWRYRSRRRGCVWRVAGLTPFGWRLWPDWPGHTINAAGGYKSLLRSADDLDDATKWERRDA